MAESIGQFGSGREPRAQVERRDEIDGTRWLLPAPLDNPVRRQAGTLLIMLSFIELIVTGSIVGVVMFQASSSAPAAVKWGVMGVVVLGAVVMVLVGVLLWRSTTEVLLGRDALRSKAGLGLLMVRRRVRLDDVSALVLEREILKGVNVPGAREGTPNYLRLSARRGDGVRRKTIASGHHRDLLEPLAQELAERIGVEVEDLESERG